MQDEQPLASLIEIPGEIDSRGEPVVKGKGVPVWVLVAYSQKHGMTPGQICMLWEGWLTLAVVKAAFSYAEAFPDTVENKLAPTPDLLDSHNK
ncbi:MAG: DUF433 domain-containing protein [Chloroflexi bacterium]|nr:DUF433 domain-containing protein [Chloroflexota bacterium]